MKKRKVLEKLMNIEAEVLSAKMTVQILRKVPSIWNNFHDNVYDCEYIENVLNSVSESLNDTCRIVENEIKELLVDSNDYE